MQRAAPVGGDAVVAPNDYNNYHYFAVQLHPTAIMGALEQDAGHPHLDHFDHRLNRRAIAFHGRAEDIAAEAGVVFLGRVGALHDYFQFAVPRTQPRTVESLEGEAESSDQPTDAGAALARFLEDHPDIVWAEQQIPKRRLFKRNPPSPPEPDLGSGHHQRRKEKQEAPSASASELINQVPNEQGNDINVTGVWDQGVRILSGPLTEVDEAAAINYDMQNNLIFSCSWGPADNGMAMEAPPKIVVDAFYNGIVNGRGGLVSSIDRKNNHPAYSEMCSANLVVTYSSATVRSDESIVTSDWQKGHTGENLCTSGHGGTSAAAPLVSGIYALLLSIRPDLTWRDVQHLTVKTAIPISLEDDSWQSTPAGYKYSHKFGYGKINAFALIEAGKTWQLVNKQASLATPVVIVNKPFPQAPGQDVRGSYKLTEQAMETAGLWRLEHVTVTVTIQHGRRGDVAVDLISPNGVVSNVGVQRQNDNDASGFSNWTFMTVAHWHEPPVGIWQLVVKDKADSSKTGMFESFYLTFWGESSPTSKSASPLAPTSKPSSAATIAPLPSDADVDDASEGVLGGTNEAEQLDRIGEEDGEEETLEGVPGGSSGGSEAEKVNRPGAAVEDDNDESGAAAGPAAAAPLLVLLAVAVALVAVALAWRLVPAPPAVRRLLQRWLPRAATAPGLSMPSSSAASTSRLMLAREPPGVAALRRQDESFDDLEMAEAPPMRQSSPARTAAGGMAAAVAAAVSSGGRGYARALQEDPDEPGPAGAS
ncbi:pheromone processing endoprotease [Cladochytrium tenue]|nr:pheromone processing endoprotease [Cladochytrium tenue]